MPREARVHPDSVLLVTLDSCRYDTFEAADAPSLKAVGELHRAYAPANFTFASHSAIFAGFTPGVPAERTAFVNPKYGKLFKLRDGGLAGPGGAFFVLDGANIIQGFKQRGYRTFGSGAVGWFDTSTEPGKILGKDFDEFYFPGKYRFARQQVEWLEQRLDEAADTPVFAFLNVGETHVPYYHEGADWDPDDNPCRPYSRGNDAEKCRVRQRSCLEFVDRALAPLLARFGEATTLVCADHGDAWGEDGLWEHGIHHETVLAVPLVLRLPQRRKPDIPGGAQQLVGRAARRLRHGRGANVGFLSGEPAPRK